VFKQIRDTLKLTRPRSLMRMQKSLDDLVEGVRELRQAAKEQREWNKAIELRQQRGDAAALATRLDDINARLEELTTKLGVLTIREAQLRAIATVDAQLEEAAEQLPAICDKARVFEHVRQAVARTPLQTDPLPFMVIRDVFPPDFYDALVLGIPPYEVFADRPRNKSVTRLW